jgi:hypothetical protein
MVPERDSFREKLVRVDLPLFINVVIRDGHSQQNGRYGSRSGCSTGRRGHCEYRPGIDADRLVNRTLSNSLELAAVHIFIPVTAPECSEHDAVGPKNALRL